MSYTDTPHNISKITPYVIMEKEKIDERYIFHFLSPDSYTTFFNHLKDGSVLEGQSKFRCTLENLLEEA